LDKFVVNIGGSIELEHNIYPEMDGHIERVNQVMEDMLMMYVMDNQTHWEKYLPLMKFSYNNIFHGLNWNASLLRFYIIGHVWTLLSWERLEDRVTVGPKLIQEMEYSIQIRQWLKEEHIYKSYAYAHRTNLSYEVGY
jgi:hypothetical protein